VFRLGALAGSLLTHQIIYIDGLDESIVVKKSLFFVGFIVYTSQGAIIPNFSSSRNFKTDCVAKTNPILA
jgi:hypothetical protein